jgi:hypothetical protein
LASCPQATPRGPVRPVPGRTYQRSIMDEPEGHFSSAPRPAAERQVYTLKIRAEPDCHETRQLRLLLKVMLRWFKFRCVSIEPDRGMNL